MKTTIVVFFLLLASDVDLNYEDINPGLTVPISKADKLSEAMPTIVQKLFEWPEKTTLGGDKRADPTSKDVVHARESSWKWIKAVFDESWLPPQNAEMIYLKKEFEIVENDSKKNPARSYPDTARISWERNNFKIEVSQVQSVFVMKLTPQGNLDSGRDKQSRYEYAKGVFSKIVSAKGEMSAIAEDGVGYSIQIPDFREKIISFTFYPSKTRELPTDKIVVGNPKSMKDEGIDVTSLFKESGSGEFSVELMKKGEHSVENLLKEPGAWEYWFRQIHWWNDGKAVGFYFIKLSGPGGWFPSFTARVNQDWIGPPRNRKGEIIPEEK